MASPAGAQNTEGAVRLGLDGVLFAGEFGTYEGSGSGDVDTTATNAGLYAGSLGFGLGYAFGKNGVVGARLFHGTSEYEVEGLEESTTRFTLLPYAEYVATPSPTIQPFFAGSLGFQIGSSESDDVKSTTSSFLVGLTAGLHLFATDTFSIDPHFSYLRATGAASVGSVDVDYGANVFVLGFSLSGWIGGASSGERHGPQGTEASSMAAEPMADEAAAPAAAPPAPPPAELKLAEEGELLSGALGLGVGQLTLLGRPTVDAENIAVRITVRGNELENCRAGTLIAGDTRFELRNVIGRAREHGSMTLVVLQGSVSPRELSAFTDAEVARIALCGRVITVTPEQREAIARYFEQFRHRAVEANTWNEPTQSSDKAPATAPGRTEPARPASPATSPSPAAAPEKAAPKPAKSPPSTPVPNGNAPPTGSFDTP